MPAAGNMKMSLALTVEVFFAEIAVAAFEDGVEEAVF
jgi:hypothetical protein